jgi:hypothetical protein
VTTPAEAAVLLAHRGSRVFPVGADKAPRISSGHLGASDIPERVQKWADDGLFEDGGIGLVIPERVFVVDVDPRNGGEATLRTTQQSCREEMPRTRTVKTRSGGRHYYYALPDDRELRGSLGPGVDIKKPGRGYVLVPPTPGYLYLVGGRPAPAPEWLLDELTIAKRIADVAAAPKYFKLVGGTGYGLATLRNALERVRTQGEGGRRALLNTEAFVLGSLCAGGELDEDRALESLLDAALDTGLSEKQALSAIKSGWHAGLLNPRSAE